MTRTVAVTGATGFIGKALVSALPACGWAVRALSRSSSKRHGFNGLPIQWVEGSLEDAGSLQRLLTDVDAVIHCAGAVRGITSAQFDQVNEAGVKRIVEAALSQETPPRLIALSSLAAREPSLSHYAASKRKGEEVLLAVQDELNWLALRPPAVYGPGERELLPLFQLMARGLALVPGGREARFSLLYIDDLVQAIIRGLETDPCPSGIFELDDGQLAGYSWDDVAEVFVSIRGKRVMRWPVPALLLQVMAVANQLTARLGGYAPMLTPGKVRELRHLDWVCHHAESWRHVSEWSPRITLVEGLKRTLASAGA